MSKEELQALQDALNLKQRELDLLTAIDDVRDSVHESTAMMRALVDLLTERLPADLCMMFLVDRETGDVELKATSVRRQELASLQQVISRRLAEQAVALDDVAIWRADDVLPAQALTSLSPKLQLAAVPIIMGTTERLGALLLARTEPPFGTDDVQLLTIAEDQIDSAVIQARVHEQHLASIAEARLWQKKLDLLTAADEIRDTRAEPTGMMIALVDLLTERLPADLCMMFLVDRETGDVELKALSVRRQELASLQQVISRQLAEQAVALDDVAIWQADDVLPSHALTSLSPKLQLAAVPIIMGTTERLGALLLARTEPPFGTNDVQLLTIAEDQIDSAVIQARVHEQHKLTVKEVDTIYRIDQIRDQGLSLDDMLSRVLEALIATIEAEMGFIMLYDRTGTHLETRAATHADLLQTLPYQQIIEQIVGEALAHGQLLRRTGMNDHSRSTMCLPLILNEQIIGVLGVVHHKGGHGFTSADGRLLKAIGSQIDTAIYERREIRQLRQVLGRSVDPRVMERLLASPDLDILRPERLELTVLYADMRGSTPLAEETDPEIFVELIRDYLARMAEVILAHEGTVDKFVGDEVMALFGAPIPQQDHALRAVQVGLAMQEAYRSTIEDWRGRGVAAPQIGIGIVSGRMIVGEMGSAQRSDYTVIGRDANLGARICKIAEGGQVLISEATYDLVKDRVEAVPLPHQHFKGIPGDVTVYHVTDCR